MSRLPRLIDPQAAWLRGLRAALRRVQAEARRLLVAPGTAGCDFVRRGAERLGIPFERVDVASPTSSVPAGTPDAESLPERDRVLLEAAESVIVLGVRTNGNLHQLLCERLAAKREVVLVDIADLQPQTVRASLLESGAVRWIPSDESQRPLHSLDEVPAEPLDTVRAVPDTSVIEIVPFPSRDQWTMLSHTTRGCPGPWPEQPPHEYLDTLLDQTFDADHAAVATLARIVRQRRLIASSRTIRGGHRVVSFTAVPLLDLPQLRQFRVHRARWDFEPFGLCIRRGWLEQRGARPVVYGDEACWRDLSDEDRPFFQLGVPDRSDADSPAATIDWSVEQEWRHAGDLDLHALSADDALVFVPYFADAQRLAAVTPWPITLWPDPAIDVSVAMQQSHE